MKVVQQSKVLMKTSKTAKKEYMISLGKEMFLKNPETPIAICHVSKVK